MIYLGTDIVPICRIESIIHERGARFLNHIFTNHEQHICNSKSIPAIHYSGKYAAKEAVKKILLSSKIIDNMPLRSIEVQNDDSGAPVINLLDKNLKQYKIIASISHAGEYATATAILEME